MDNIGAIHIRLPDGTRIPVKDDPARQTVLSVQAEVQEINEKITKIFSDILTCQTDIEDHYTYIQNLLSRLDNLKLDGVDNIGTDISWLKESVVDNAERLTNLNIIVSDLSYNLTNLSSSVGAIEEAVNGIIAIQNGLIGGDSE